MSPIARCPKCQARYKNIEPKHVGRKTTCKKCNSEFMITISSAPADIDKPKTGMWDVGDVILDKYRVTEVLGVGGMGTVHKIHHLDWHLDLAVKSPNSAALKRAKGKANFLREAETWVNLGLHPNVVNCYYVREIGGIPRVFSEYVNGGTLKEWIRDGKLVQLETMLDAAIQVAWGLHYAHEQGIVHQDVKTANVMMTSDGVAKIADFGLAKAKPMTEADYMELDSDTAIDIHATYRGMTPAFCSPEQAMKQKLTAATDIWSWGLCVLEIFIGKVTWRSGTKAMETLEQYLKPKPGYSRLPKMPSSIAWLLRDCFNQNPAKRPPSLLKAAEIIRLYYYDKLGVKYPRQLPKTGVDSADSFNNRALSLIDIGQKPEALETWERALALQPFHPESTYNSCLVKWRNGAMPYEAVEKRMKEELEPGQDLWLNKYLLGLVYLEKGDKDSAKKMLGSITGMAGKNKDIRTAIDVAKKQSDEKFIAPFRLSAVRKIEKIISTESEFKKELALGQKATTAKELDKAVTYIQRARALSGFGRRPEALDAWSRLYSLLSHKSFAGAWEEVTLPEQSGGINVVSFSPKGDHALAGGESGLTVWDLSSGKPKVVSKHENHINSACFSSDGEFVLTGGNNKV